MVVHALAVPGSPPTRRRAGPWGSRDGVASPKRTCLGKGAIVIGPRERPFQPTSIYKRARRAWAETNLEPIGLHDCRHTCASYFIAAGVNAKTLSTFLGHASVTITLDRYGHLFPGSEAEAAGMLDAYLARADTSERLGQLAG